MRELGTRTLPRATSRTTLLAGGLILALVTVLLGPMLLPDEAIAASRWRQFVAADVPIVPAAPAPGSPEERADLDALLAIQAGATSRDTEELDLWLGSAAIESWNDALLAIVREEKQNPVRVSRSLALLNVAIYDALIAACREQVANDAATPRERDRRVSETGPIGPRGTYPSGEAAVASAAEAVLTYLHPGRAATFAALAKSARRAPVVAGTTLPSAVEAGDLIGRAVGAAIVARGQSDGSTALWDGVIPTGDGIWKAAPTAIGGPLEPRAGTWTPWLLTSGSEVRPPPPPSFGTLEWQRDADEVVRVTENLTNEQVRIARFWGDGGGTDTPAGHWARIGFSLIRRDGLTMPYAARVMAYVSVAQADAFIACWDAKFAYWSGRPTGLIKGFASTIITPNFPSYPSGHSTQSAAASVVLGHFFRADKGRLNAMAEEAAISRLYGGIHYRFDNQIGLDMGREIGRRAVQRAADGPG